MLGPSDQRLGEGAADFRLPLGVPGLELWIANGHAPVLAVQDEGLTVLGQLPGKLPGSFH
jgi:hypothetical protein